MELHLSVTHLPSLQLIVMERVITINRSNVSFTHKLLLNIIVWKNYLSAYLRSNYVQLNYVLVKLTPSSLEATIENTTKALRSMYQSQNGTHILMHMTLQTKRSMVNGYHRYFTGTIHFFSWGNMYSSRIIFSQPVFHHCLTRIIQVKTSLHLDGDKQIHTTSCLWATFLKLRCCK